MDTSTSQPPSKRPRTDSSDSTAHSPLVTRSTPWFEDGNIILETEQTQFKVFRGILAANSAIFCDMFAAAEPDSQGLVEGCPVVHLGDKPDDLRYVLEALHNLRKWVEDISDEEKLMPVPVLGAFLRLGRKYEIDHLRKQALKRLAVDFPTDLDTCTRIMSKIRTLSLRPESWPTSIDIKLKEGDLLTLINILRDNDLGVFLPFVFSVVVFCDIRLELSVLQRSPHNGEPILSLDDIDLVVRASRKIAHLPSTGAMSWTEHSPRYATCESNRCDEARGKIAFRWYKHSIPVLPLFKEWSVQWDQGGLFCDPCKVQGRIMYREGQEKIWEMLPDLYGLPGWEELRLQQST
ncbi:hypothetical protein FIBSPDRAFT_1047099 [Athelia psychrophila]|uniref:BTB domain-containing protein n=1 Tax=Athelia psychrophila TaxID=1759441 RepID=A0A166FMS2_9AGAM|nr:hypothetical protein FIBSPDRAFT_1047099 [Fibularhizoctonia sp. CBS 109695]